MAVGSAGAAPVECPDPSVHERDHRLQDQASKAALYVTNSEPVSDTRRTIPALGPDGKLSSAGAAASLKHAQPHELPSFPTVGIDATSSGNKAANLAHANQKPFEHWKPELSSTAGKAALIAHKDGGKLDLWQHAPSDTGHSAAGIAMGKQHGLSPQLDYGYTDDGKKKALLAATLSVAGHGKPPPQPEPAPAYPDAENASANALNAATVAHRPVSARDQDSFQVSSPANEAARITHLGPNVNRAMFTSHPNIDGDDDATKQQALRGAALSVERDRANKAKEADAEPPLMGADPQTVGKNYLNLQEQAHKLAQERLAKLDPNGVSAYREHYGYGNSPPRSKLSIRNRRSRATSKGDDEEDEDDAANARRIRHQMNKFNDDLADADAKKRQKDRSSVLAAAEKNVRARMSHIDQDIFDQTGKVTPQMMEQWEAKARAKAAGESEKRLENHGMVHIGGGKYMDQSEITAIAQDRMQPTLNEINDNAEKQRQRDEEIRQDVEERKRVAAAEKSKKEDEKMQAKFEKAQQKQHQKEFKDMDKEEKRLQKEQRKRQEQDWKREQQEAQGKGKGAEETRAEELDGGAAGASAAVAGSAGYSATATGAPAAEQHEVQRASEALQKETVQTEGAADGGARKEDPPGVPTDVGQKSPFSSSGAFQGDAGVEARKAENDEKLRDIGIERTPTANKDKRHSRVRSFFGKFKRNSKGSDSDSGVAAKPEHDTKGKDVAAPVAAGAATGVVAGAGAATAIEAGLHDEQATSPADEEAKKDEFHKAVTSAKDDDDDDDDDEADEGLYSAPSQEAASHEATSTILAGELSADAGGSAGAWASTTQHEVAERGNSVEVSRPSTAVQATAVVLGPESTTTTTAVTTTTAREPDSIRGSVVTTSDEYEEARDKFDEDEAHETATLKAPEPARARTDTSPHSRPTSKFQEELEED